MLNHYTMKNEKNELIFQISHQEEIPYGYPNPGLYQQLVLNNEGGNCPDCGTWSTVVHEYCAKVATAGSYNGSPIYDSFIHRRFKCGNCHRTFVERLPWLHLHQRLTEAGKNALLHAAAESTFQAVGEDFGRSRQNVKVHVRHHCQASQDSHLQERPTPTWLGIDEISLAKGKSSYSLVVYDLTVPWRPELVKIHESRQKKDVISILQQFSHPERITAIAIDMWEPYKIAIETALPHARVVIDAFHLIQASTRALDEIRKQAQKKLDKKESLALKKEKELFTKAIEELSEEERERLQFWQDSIPELAQAISLHQKLRSLYRLHDFEEALTHLVEWESAVLATSLEPFHRLLQTVYNWLPEIMNRFFCKISNAKTEGKNNQLRSLNKQGFGYSISSLQARMEIKEQRTALRRWRRYQDRIQRRSA
jgi:transposase